MPAACFVPFKLPGAMHVSQCHAAMPTTFCIGISQFYSVYPKAQLLLEVVFTVSVLPVWDPCAAPFPA